MADMEDISAILGLLASGGEEKQGNDSGESTGGIFGDIDPEMLLRLVSVFSQLGERDRNTDLLLALKPHLRAENRPKVDNAVQIMKLITIMSALNDNNLFN
ncbi:MAG: hypothetical protein J6A41_02115 [Ruminiclostridium sp.]|nr:hypothetical protein [Ruminiclostridium sp.]